MTANSVSNKCKDFAKEVENRVNGLVEIAEKSDSFVRPAVRWKYECSVRSFRGLMQQTNRVWRRIRKLIPDRSVHVIVEYCYADPLEDVAGESYDIGKEHSEIWLVESDSSDAIIEPAIENSRKVARDKEGFLRLVRKLEVKYGACLYGIGNGGVELFVTSTKSNWCSLATDVVEYDAFYYHGLVDDLNESADRLRRTRLVSIGWYYPKLSFDED